MQLYLKEQLVAKIAKLPEGKIQEVLDFVDFLLSKSSKKKSHSNDASDQEILGAIEASGSLDFYYDVSQDVYTLEDGEPL